MTSEPPQNAPEAGGTRRKRRKPLLIGIVALLVVALAAAAAIVVLGGDEDKESVEASGAGSGETEDPEATSTEPEKATTSTSTTSTTDPTTTSTRPETVPNLVGMTLDEANARVRGTGIEIKVVNVADDVSPSGTVLKQVPEADTDYEEIVTVNVARPSVKTYIANMEPVEESNGGIYQSGNFTLNTHVYTQSFNMQTCVYSRELSQSAGYDLGRSYTRFRAVVGMADDAISGSWAKFEVFGDGRLLAEVDGSLGAPASIDADVSGVLRLTLKASGIDCDGFSSNGYSYAVFADPYLTSAPLPE